jgi:hypothetical protein
VAIEFERADNPADAVGRDRFAHRFNVVGAKQKRDARRRLRRLELNRSRIPTAETLTGVASIGSRMQAQAPAIEGGRSSPSAHSIRSRFRVDATAAANVPSLPLRSGRNSFFALAKPLPIQRAIEGRHDRRPPQASPDVCESIATVRMPKRGASVLYCLADADGFSLYVIAMNVDDVSRRCLR